MPASRNILVLYTGGTIGMQQSANGLMPASGFASRLREQQGRQPEMILPDWRFHELLPAIDSAALSSDQVLGGETVEHAGHGAAVQIQNAHQLGRGTGVSVTEQHDDLELRGGQVVLDDLTLDDPVLELIDQRNQVTDRMLQGEAVAIEVRHKSLPRQQMLRDVTA